MIKKLRHDFTVTYPDDFPLSDSLRCVLTERIKTLFEKQGILSSDDRSLAEKLVDLRKEMRESIEAPYSSPPFFSAYPEEHLSWKGLQTKSLDDLSPSARDAGLKMAGRILGVELHYHVPDDDVLADDAVLPSAHPVKLCPFAKPGRIGELVAEWHGDDLHRLRRSFDRHLVTALAVAFIAGLGLGTSLPPMGGTTPRHHGRQILYPSGPTFVPNSASLPNEPAQRSIPHAGGQPSVEAPSRPVQSPAGIAPPQGAAPGANIL